MGRTSAPRRRVAVLSTATRRWSQRGREVLLDKQDLPNSEKAPAARLDARALVTLADHWYTHGGGIAQQVPAERRRFCTVAGGTFV